MVSYFSAFLIGVFVWYSFALLWLLWHWRQSRVRTKILLQEPFAPTQDLYVSVVIAVRNEIQNLPNLIQDLEKQSLAKHCFEVIVIDDQSSDGTSTFLKSLQTTLNFVYMASDNVENTVAYKKKAIAQGIAIARGELIVCTDGDCRVSEHWLQNFVQAQTTSNAVFISAPVAYLPSNEVFMQMQTIEFASLIGTGGACMNAGFPNMCNGANLAYLKSAYHAVDGFAGTTQIASGDDELLLHKMKEHFSSDKVLFINHSGSVVFTNAHRSWSSFQQQRKRWASKWSYYQDIKISLLAIATAALHGLFLFVWFAPLFEIISWKTAAILLITKMLSEYFLLKVVVKNCDAQWKNRAFFALQCLHSAYVLFFGLSAAFFRNKGYEWKGRKVS